METDRVLRVQPGVRPGPIRTGLTLIEILVAVFLATTVFGATILFMRMGQQSVVKTSDHAEARAEALRVLDEVGWDLDRLLVGDRVNDARASVRQPFRSLVDERFGSTFGFYAFNRRIYYKALKRMVLIGQWVDYLVKPRPAGQGVDLLRNGRPVNRIPLHDVRLERLSDTKAKALGVSRDHSITVKIYPRGTWDTRNANLWLEANVQKKTFHLKGVESRYACLMSLKRVLDDEGKGYPAGYEDLQYLPPPLPFDTAGGYVGNVILNWMQPQDLVVLQDRIFEDERADLHEEIPPTASS